MGWRTTASDLIMAGLKVNNLQRAGISRFAFTNASEVSLVGVVAAHTYKAVKWWSSHQSFLFLPAHLVIVVLTSSSIS